MKVDEFECIHKRLLLSSIAHHSPVDVNAKKENLVFYFLEQPQPQNLPFHSLDLPVHTGLGVKVQRHEAEVPEVARAVPDLKQAPLRVAGERGPAVVLPQSGGQGPLRLTGIWSGGRATPFFFGLPTPRGGQFQLSRNQSRFENQTGTSYPTPGAGDLDLAAWDKSNEKRWGGSVVQNLTLRGSGMIRSTWMEWGG